MRQKGFSLVELSVVLVVVGIIVLFAVRSNAIKQSTLTKAEITKLNSFIVAVNSYIILTDNVPPAELLLGTEQVVDNELFHDMKLLTPERTAYYEGGEWVMQYCVLSGADGYYNYDNSSASFDLCARVDNLSMNAYLACSIEAALDDREPLKGNARFYGSTNSAFTAAALQDCPAARRLLPVDYAYRVYTGSDSKF